MANGSPRSPGIRSWVGLAQLLGALLLLLLTSAWTLHYPEAWTYVALFGACTAAITLYLQRHDPALLERRLVAGPRAERRRPQRVIQLAATLAFVAVYVVAGLDRRFRWSTIPRSAVVLGHLLVVAGLGIVFLAFRANSYASATVETVEGQMVVSTGPYAAVRHPMYSGALLMLVGTPLALGSLWALACLVPMTAAIVSRLHDDERVLTHSLPGYASYRSRVKSRLVPYVW